MSRAILITPDLLARSTPLLISRRMAPKRLESTESSIGSKSGAAADMAPPPTVIVSDSEWGRSSMAAIPEGPARGAPGAGELAKFPPRRPSRQPGPGFRRDNVGSCGLGVLSLSLIHTQSGL